MRDRPQRGPGAGGPHPGAAQRHPGQGRAAPPGGVLGPVPLRPTFPLTEALAYLDGHVNFERAAARRVKPTLERMRSLCALMGDPQRAYPVVAVTGTNGKGSTTRLLSAILAEHGLSVGTYTSPHLERLNERLAWNDEVIDDEGLAQVLLEVRSYEEHLALELTHFEVLTAAAFRWFADVAVDVAVLEVGMGGRWDSTNVADGEVAVVTNIGLDHAEIIGPTRREIAIEKAGIIKEGATVVLGETSADLADVFAATPAGATWVRDHDFGAERNLVAIGGRLIDVRTPSGVLDDLFMPLHGPHQGDNAACAVAAAEAFFGRPLDADVVRAAMAKVTVPGRFEVMGRRPFVVLDGAHNPDGARALAATLDEDFAGRRPDVCVVGFTQGRDAAEMLEILRASESRLVVVCPPPTPRALPVAEVMAAAESLGVRSESAPDVAGAVSRALDEAGEDEFVLVTGSLYVVGDARTALRR